MARSRRALIVANDDYADPGLDGLSSPSADAAELEEVLSAPDIGDFDVQVSRNDPNHLLLAQIEDFFVEAVPDDLLLLYFSGHGVKAATGDLFLAAHNTRPSRLASSAVAADFVQRCMRSSRSRSVVLFLDCCYGGAFPQGTAVRSSGSVDVMASFPGEGTRSRGRGRAVITASSSMEYAFEGTRLAGAQVRPSVFSGALVHGLRTGDADRDEDGLISLDELYDYLYEQVRLANPAQTPSRQFDLQGELHIAKSRRRVLRPAALPADLQAALRDSSMFARIGALTELSRRFAGDDLADAVAAYQALRDISAHDIGQVASLAQTALDVGRLHLSPSPLLVAPAPDGSSSEHQLRLVGIPLARAVTLRSNSRQVQARVNGNAVDVTITWPVPAGVPVDITAESPTDVVTVPVEIGGPSLPAAARAAGDATAGASLVLPVASPAPAGAGRSGASRRIRQPVLSPILFAAWSLVWALAELKTSSPVLTAVPAALGAATVVVAALEWLLLTRVDGVWLVTMAGNSLFLILGGFSMDRPQTSARAVASVVFNAAVLIAAYRLRRERVTRSGAVVLLVSLTLTWSLLVAANSIALGTSSYDVATAMNTLAGFANLAAGAVCAWLAILLGGLARRSG